MEELLRQIKAIYPLSNEVEEYLVKHLKYRILKKNEYLIKAGQVSRTANYVEKGLLRAYIVKESKEFTVDFFPEGEVSITLKSFLPQIPSTEFVQALEKTSIIYLDYNDIRFLRSNHAEANKVFEAIISNAHYTFSDQRDEMKILSASERYSWFLEHHPDLILRVPAKYIASYLGISQNSLSRIKKQKK